MKTEDVERIHEASLRILDEVGVRLEHDAVVGRLLAAGARRGLGPHDVRLPPAMVRELVALAPRVELAARNGTTTLLEPQSEAVFWTTPVLYLWTGTERRRVTSEDLLAIARLSDRLDAVQGVIAWRWPTCRASSSRPGCSTGAPGAPARARCRRWRRLGPASSWLAAPSRR